MNGLFLPETEIRQEHSACDYCKAKLSGRRILWFGYMRVCTVCYKNVPISEFIRLKKNYQN
jgi:hypothetical protein